MPRAPAATPPDFATFGDFLKYLRRRSQLTQAELAIACGYSPPHISHLENNQRLPDQATLLALFVTALSLQDEPELVERLLELAGARREEPAPGKAPQAVPPPRNILPARPTPLLLGLFSLLTRRDLTIRTAAGYPVKSRLRAQSASRYSPWSLRLVSMPNDSPPRSRMR